MVKGQAARDLVLAWHEASGALLFVSELPNSLRQRFDLCIDVGRLVWHGEPLDFTKVEPRPAPKEANALASAALTLPDAPTLPALPVISLVHA